MSAKKCVILLLFLLLAARPVMASAPLVYDYKEYKSLIGRKKNPDYRLRVKSPSIGIVSHHLPTASPLIDNFYYQLRKNRPNIKTFVVLGPDHSERCRQKFAVSDADIMTMYGSIAADKKMIKRIEAAGAKMENHCFEGEHAIGVQASYIRKFFPQARIAPILLSFAARQSDFSGLVSELEKNRSDIFVVASVDFTHYMDVQQAEAIDAISLKMINGLEGGSFSLKQIDSPATIKAVLCLARRLGLQAEIVEHKNSFDYNGAYKNTTSYFSVFF